MSTSNYLTIDNIVNSVLLQRGYPRHYYLQFAKYAADCVRELHFSSLRVIKTDLIEVDKNGFAEFPCDYVSWIRVGLVHGKQVVPLNLATTLNRIPNYDEGGNIIPYGDADFHVYPNIYDYAYGFTYNRWSWQGGFHEHDGKLSFGEYLIGNKIILDYVATALNCDNLTKIDQRAQACIESYVIWKMKEHSRAYSKNEAMAEFNLYDRERRRLHSRLNPISISEIQTIFSGGNKQKW